MKTVFCLALTLLLCTAGPAPAQLARIGALEPIAQFGDRQVTGVAVSNEGRIFVCFPYWADAHSLSVAEVRSDRSLRPFPAGAWNEKTGPAARQFVCVQSVVIDASNALWIVDAGSPRQEGVIEGGPKLIKVDLQTNTITQVIPFGQREVPKDSYLNDVRIETASDTAYLTDSTLGALLVVNLKSGRTRRVLDDHYSTQAEAGEIVVEGMRPIDPTTRLSPVVAADGIALDAARGMLYFHALSGRGLYRIPTADLRNETLDPRELGRRVVKVADTAKTDGMEFGADGQLYLTAFEENAVVKVDPATGQSTTLVRDRRLQWPDTLSWGPDGLYVTTSQIHRAAKYNAGISRRTEPYALWRIPTPNEITSARSQR